nr:putative RNA-directed DNA polymerase, eukaryota, reverse transcriptase zinc-binding domain protein [Tanacetum cinerariifolium]
MGSNRFQSSLQSKFDLTAKISKSVFVSNFPEGCSNRDLWKVCSDFGTVVDVFIPNKKSKAGKRFAFVRFIKVLNFDRLILNLNTIWIGRFHLSANPARFERPIAASNYKGILRSNGPATGLRHSKVQVTGGSYVNVVNGASKKAFGSGPVLSDAAALVLNESCAVDHDLSKHVMGKVKDAKSISNLRTILRDESFSEVNVSYLGGLWVLFECDSADTKANLMRHTCVLSWLHTIQDAAHDFGEMLDIEDNVDSSFGRKRLCDLTKQPLAIFESFKVIYKGKVLMVRAKELVTWNPTILSDKEKDYCSDDESMHNSKKGSVHSVDNEDVSNAGFESDVEGVAEANFEDNTSHPINERACPVSPSLSHPPGFTPEILVNQVDKAIGGEEFSSAANVKVSNSPHVVFQDANSSSINPGIVKTGGSVLGVLEDMIRVGQAMGYKMDGCVKDLECIIENQGADDETKMHSISHMEVKFMWGNSNYDYVYIEALGFSGGILCVWEASVFKKDYATISDNFVAIYGTWLPSNSKVLFVAIYAPQQASCKRVLWEYVSSLIGRWRGETVIMGDFNEVRSIDERRGSCFNSSSARVFDQFISLAGLVDVKMEGFAFIWSHPSGSKMSKLDRFLVSEGIFLTFPSISVLCLERHLSDHRPIILREVFSDFGLIPFRFYHSWFNLEGFDDMVEQSWRAFSHSDANRRIRFKKKLQDLKVIIRGWVKNRRAGRYGDLIAIKNELCVIDKKVDGGVVSDSSLLRRMELQRKLYDFNQLAAIDSVQKSKVKWAIEGDENLKFFHGIINRRRSYLAIRGVFDKGNWVFDPRLVKEVFCKHFESRFKKPVGQRFLLDFSFKNRLSNLQASDLESHVTRDEIRSAIWSCGENKSPGPDGYSFEFFKKYWNFVGPDLCEAVEYFFETGLFAEGYNSSFIALIPKVADAKLVNDFRPISLIGCIHKVVTKILANWLSLVIVDLVSDTQSAFIANRHILDGPFILNEILHWCKRKNKQAMFFKVDFAKAYDTVRWDYLLDVLEAFGFGHTWCNWIPGTLSSARASVLVNGSPSKEFSFHCGLKQGDPLSPFFFILIMESLHLSFSQAVDEGVFKGVQLNRSLSISHLFYADDAMFIGEWSDANLKGVMVRKCMSRHQAWEDVVFKLRSRLSKWKVKTLSIDGRLTLLKSVFGASPKITWAACDKILASKKNGGLGVSSFHALNRALLLKWVWRFISQDGSLWFRVIHALYGADIGSHSVTFSFNWCSIVREFYFLKGKGFDLLSYCTKRIGDENGTRFWYDKWVGDKSLMESFPRLFALEEDKELVVADKFKAALDVSFRRQVRNGAELQQLEELSTLMDSVMVVFG